MHVSERPAAGVAAAKSAPRVGDGSSAGPRPRGWPALVVGLLMLLGVAVRVSYADQSLFADELSTYWIITTNGLGGVISIVHSNAEITPPLYFAASWLTTQIGHAPELVRAPSLVAGAVSIPLIYLLGLRTVGRPAALVATALTALSPFMIYYSAEARGYALMMALVMLSTLAMLIAVDSGRARWWVIYAAASCAAVYTHYTCVFVLGAQFLWLLWAHPEARRSALLANAGAVVAFLPWTTGVINDFNSPTNKILTALSPFNAHAVRVSLEHWAIGYPYSIVRLPDLPGRPALVLLALALIVAVAGVGIRVWRERTRQRAGSLDRRLVLVLAILFSVPVGEAIMSAVSTHLFGVRNLAAAWPALALCLAALLIAAGPRLRFVAVALTVASFAIGAAKLLQASHQRPNYRAVADFIDRHAAPGDVVIDETAALSPGPFSPLDLTLRRPHRVYRVLAPQEHDHPFTLIDPLVPLSEGARKAIAAAGGARIFRVTDPLRARIVRPLSPFQVVETHGYPGIVSLVVQVYAARTSPRG